MGTFLSGGGRAHFDCNQVRKLHHRFAVGFEMGLRGLECHLNREPVLLPVSDEESEVPRALQHQVLLAVTALHCLLDEGSLNVVQPFEQSHSLPFWRASRASKIASIAWIAFRELGKPRSKLALNSLAALATASRSSIRSHASSRRARSSPWVTANF